MQRERQATGHAVAGGCVAISGAPGSVGAAAGLSHASGGLGDMLDIDARDLVDAVGTALTGWFSGGVLQVA